MLHTPTMSKGPLSHPTAQGCLLLERTGTGSLSRGPRSLIEGGEVNLGYWVWPLPLYWSRWTCIHDLISMRRAIPIPRLALLSVAVAASPSKGVLEDDISA